jgi:hypothetical protein
MSSVTKTKKRKTPSQRSLSRIQADFFNASNSRIVSKELQDSTSPTKEFSQSSHNCSELLTLIDEQRFSDCLQHLEDAGYTGNAAIFVLRCLQVVGGAA